MGSSNPGAFGSYHHSNAQGCYVATCVYGSYDCPEVWTLRRFRDDTLAQSYLGRAFIHIYYAVSPTIVRFFGKCTWFQQYWRKKLDRLVGSLRKKGVTSTPYQDRLWK
ncbi:MAG: CFI-box-CTERM domain-containing protein [Oscillospiraceae bacterium]